MEELNRQIQEKKTDEQKLEKVLSEYDLDKELEDELTAIKNKFLLLRSKYQALLNTRRFLKDGN